MRSSWNELLQPSFWNLRFPIHDGSYEVDGGAILTSDWQSNQFLMESSNPIYFMGELLIGIRAAGIEVRLDILLDLEGLETATQMTEEAKKSLGSFVRNEPPLPKSKMDHWFESQRIKIASMSNASIISAIRAAHPRHFISRDRILNQRRAIDGKRKRGPKPFSGKVPDK